MKTDEQNLDYFTVREVAKRLRTTVRNLQCWRDTEKGPPYLRVNKTILYPVKALLNWEEQNMRLK